MKLIQLKCPSCGAKLEVNKELKKFTCNYCGITTLIDDEVKKTIKVKSKLTNKINEINEYYENSNYLKAYEMAIELIKEYPSNNELKKIIKDSYDHGYYYIEYNHAMKLVGSIKSNAISKEKLKELKKYMKMFPNDEIIRQKYDSYMRIKRINQIINDFGMVVLYIFILLVIIIILIPYFI